MLFEPSRLVHDHSTLTTRDLGALCHGRTIRNSGVKGKNWKMYDQPGCRGSQSIIPQTDISLHSTWALECKHHHLTGD